MDVDDLYGLPFDEFVPERNALARELRKAGKRDEAAEVAALRKPSVAAWAVDQLVRTQRKAVSELFDAGDALRAAQDDVLAGRGDGQSLRAAVERERTAVDSLAAMARGLLSPDGHELSPAIIERVADTLHAAALDDEAREQVREGRLERELRHVGLGARERRARPGAAAAAAGSVARGGAGTDLEAGAGGTSRPRRSSRTPAPPGKNESERSANRPKRAPRHGRRSARLAGAPSTPSALTGLQLERRDRAAEALSEAEAELDAAEAELREAQAQLASDAGRLTGRERGSSVHERDHDQDDHDQEQGGTADRHRTLAPPELGVGAIPAITALGRGTHPVIVVVVSAHPTSLGEVARSGC